MYYKMINKHVIKKQLVCHHTLDFGKNIFRINKIFSRSLLFFLRCLLQFTETDIYTNARLRLYFLRSCFHLYCWEPFPVVPTFFFLPLPCDKWMSSNQGSSNVSRTIMLRCACNSPATAFSSFCLFILSVSSRYLRAKLRGGAAQRSNSAL